MKTPTQCTTLIISTTLAVGLSSSALASNMAMEKCYGVVKAGHNDCGANGHSCQGQAKHDADPEEWVFLPTGLCNKLVNGRTQN